MWAIAPTLTARDICAREGLSMRRVWYLLNAGRIFPAVRMCGSWAITDPYVILPKANGRPLGARGKYPKGVKRPRKKPTTEGAVDV